MQGKIRRSKACQSTKIGAALRNSRVKCSIILPVVAVQSSGVPLRAVDSAWPEHMFSVASLFGSTPKSTLWTVLHDVRLLVLLMAFAESLSNDCGGGSLTLICQLFYYQCLTAEMAEKDARVDQPGMSFQAKGLPCALVVSCLAVVNNDGSYSTTKSVIRDISEASSMARSA